MLRALSGELFDDGLRERARAFGDDRLFETKLPIRPSSPLIAPVAPAPGAAAGAAARGEVAAAAATCVAVGAAPASNSLASTVTPSARARCANHARLAFNEEHKSARDAPLGKRTSNAFEREVPGIDWRAPMRAPESFASPRGFVDRSSLDGSADTLSGNHERVDGSNVT